MIIHVEPIWLVWFASIGLTLIGLLVAGGRWLVTQLQRRTDAQLALLIEDSARWREVEGLLTQLRIELPERYVRREDYIRGQAVVEGKLDALYAKLEVVQMQGAKQGEKS